MSKIRVRHGDDEIELEGSDDFIAARLAAFYEQLPKLVPVPQEHRGTAQARAAAPKNNALTPAEYFRSHGSPADGISQVLVLGKYLEEIKGKAEFAVSDINQAAKEAKFAKNIHSQYFSNAVKDGLLRRDQEGQYSLILTGEERLSKPSDGRSVTARVAVRKRRAGSPAKRDESERSDDAKNSTKPNSRSTRRPGAKATLARIYSEKFFSQPRTLNSIIQHADHNLASKFRASEFSGSLARYVRDGKLKRTKNVDGQYEYTNA